MDIKDVIGLSEPLKKLIDVVSLGIGAISKPYLIRKTADAKAYEIKKISDAIKENQIDLKQISYSENKLSLISIDSNSLKNELTLEDRTEHRTQFQEQRKQRNIENITQKAAQQLENEKEVSKDPVDEDWTTRFFNYAEEISNDEMQNLWAQILVGEIKRPKSYSLRTLQILRNLSKEEAQVFTRVANYVIKSGNDCFLYNEKNILEKFGIQFIDLALLKELDLLYAGDSVNYTLKKTSRVNKLLFVIGDKLVVIEKKPGSSDKNISIILFTSIGKELLNLIHPKPDFKYIQKLATNLKSDDIIVKYAHILEITNSNIKHTNPLLEIPEL